MDRKVTVIYYLSQAGQKESIRQGGIFNDGKQKQVFETKLTPELLELATVKPDGDIVFEIGGAGQAFFGSALYPTDPFDSPQTMDQLIAWKKAQIKKQEEYDKKAREEAEKAIEEIKEYERKRSTALKEPDKPKPSFFDWLRGW